jgi:hypothetical protein
MVALHATVLFYLGCCACSGDTCREHLAEEEVYALADACEPLSLVMFGGAGNACCNRYTLPDKTAIQ